MATPLLNRIEIFNEMASLLNSYLMLAFTDLNVEYDTKYALGWLMICTAVLCIATNLVLIFVDFGRGIYHKGKRCCRIKNRPKVREK